MKKTFNSMDIFCCAKELTHKLCGAFLNNFYFLEERIFYLKFNTKEKKKSCVAIEPGVRFNLTEMNNTQEQPQPSSFVLRIRKLIRNKKLESISLVGVDRIVKFVFGNNERSVFFYIEFFGTGNYFITDKDNKVIFTSKKGSLVYSPDIKKLPTHKEIFNYLENFSKEKHPARKIFFSGIFQDIVEHCLLSCGIDKNKPLPENIDKLTEFFYKSIQQGYGEVFDPVIILDQENLVSFRIFPLFQDKDRQTKKFNTFSEAVFYYFSELELRTFSKQTKKKENQIEKKIEGVKRQQQKRIEELEHNIKHLTICAEKIGENIQLVEECILIASFSFSCSFSMEYLERTLKSERLCGNKAACIIQNFVPKDKTIVLEIEGVTMSIDTTKTIHSNRKFIYDKRKQVMKKLQKTIQANELAVKSAERKIKKKEEKKKIPSLKTKTRKKMWFEKFNWFISSAQEVIIGGKDSTQNELLVKRYMEKDDIYLHSEISGSSSVIIKKNRNRQISRQSVFEAGLMSTVYARTWETKIPTTAWWVYPFQVTKSAETGEYLSSGSFVIRGKKNLLPPFKPEYGLGILFSVDREEKTKNTKETFYKQKYESIVQEWVVEPENIKKMEEEFGGRIEEECLYEKVSISTLTGNPEDRDTVYYVIPMCAPYNVVSTFSYRVKLVPGQFKKGQACKEIRSFFEKEIRKKIESNPERKTVLEKHISLFRGIPDTEFVETLLSKVRVECGAL